MASSSALLFGITAILVHLFINTRLCRTFESGFYASALMRGSSRITFLSGMYLVDLSHYLLFVLISKLIQYAFSFRMPGFTYVAILWAIVDPLYLYFFSYLLVNAWRMKGSTYIWLIGLFDGLCMLLNNGIANGVSSADPHSRDVGNFELRMGFLNPTWNMLASAQMSQMFTTVHMRNDPDTMA